MPRILPYCVCRVARIDSVKLNLSNEAERGHRGRAGSMPEMLFARCAILAPKSVGLLSGNAIPHGGLPLPQLPETLPFVCSRRTRIGINVAVRAIPPVACDRVVFHAPDVLERRV
jgi:hypothetical protein